MTWQGLFKLDSLDEHNASSSKPSPPKRRGHWRRDHSTRMVEGLLARGMHVHFFLRGTGFWTDVLDEHESQVVLKAFAT